MIFTIYANISFHTSLFRTFGAPIKKNSYYPYFLRNHEINNIDYLFVGSMYEGNMIGFFLG